MPRAVIYARYSTDLQNERSIADQVALCRTLADRAGYQVTTIYEDRAASGASTDRRSGFRNLMAAAKLHGFDVLLAEDVDRIARDQADYHAARKQLDYLGITIHTASGIIGRLEGSMRALMSEMFLDNLVTHTRRGLAGVVRSGRSPGGRAYGYRAVPGQPGVLAIEPNEAKIIRRIFAAAIEGQGLPAIAAELNRENIPAPRGDYWRTNTLAGHAGRACGILRNEIYTGTIVWNRVTMIRNPANGKRVSRVNPESEWQKVAAPQLRIIDDKTWRLVQAELERRRHTPTDHHRKGKAKRLLSGLLRCGSCGAGMSIKDRHHRGGQLRISCSRMQQGHDCSHSRRYYLEDIERATLAGLREHIGSREAVALFLKTYNAEKQKDAAGATANRAKLASRRDRATAEIARTVSALVAGAITEQEAAAHLPPLREERARIEEELARAPVPPKVIGLHPSAVQAYLRGLERLGDLIGEDMAAGDDEVANIIRALIETVAVIPTPAGKPPKIRVRGHLASLIAAPEHVSLGGGDSVVAGRCLAHLPPPGFEFVRVAR